MILLTDNPASNQAVPVAGDAHITNAQSLLDQARMELNLTQGEVTMFIPDMPNMPPQYAPVMIAQANQAQPGDVTTTRAIGVCKPAPNNNYSGENGLAPLAVARFYLQQYEQQKVTGPATTTILQQPKHGVLRLVTQADIGTILPSGGDPVDPAAGLYFYLPEKGYAGKDSAAILVDFGGVKVKVVYFFEAIEGVLGNDWQDDYCSEKGVFWKISSTIDVNGNSTITSVEYQSPMIDASTSTTDTATLASALGSNILSTLSVDPSAVTLTLADLPGGAVGQTNGNTITLDTNAANYNWFIDTTPADNSEFLPTSNPDEWVARNQ